ncbi:MAG: MBL fold metallo-hydrolase [Deltaproteobacteria bacterium]|nr:MBL fold metallo-hydrolase [Deltaproteobacteria bacterium]
MGQVEIQFLGSGVVLGDGGRFQICFHVNTGECRFLIDCGTSSLIAMRRFGVDPGQIDIILLSHLHGDHFGGIPFLILDAQFSRRTRPLIIAGPPGLKRRIVDAMEVFFPGSSQVPQKFIIEYIEYQDRRPVPLGVVKAIPFTVIHPSGAPSYALRVETQGKVITYSGDTEWTQALVEAARGADIFICEAYMFEKKVKYHLDYRTLMAHRKELDSPRLFLTHMREEMLAKLKDIDAEWTEDGQRVIL